MQLTNADEFFATARERYLIKIRRETDPNPPWTGDPYFRDWRFCNVFREDDKTTIWFRENVRSKLKGIDVVRATVIFRWFNRIETGEKILDLLLGKWDTKEALRRLEGHSPIVTGAYMIRTPEGMNKLEGVLYSIEEALPVLWDITSITLQGFWQELLTLYGIGPFLAYEIVSDLRWTNVLENAKDIHSWANAGPGCARGLGRVDTGERKQFNRHNDQPELLRIMQELHSRAYDKRNWPWIDERPWEMREVEHWACEYSKYCEAREGKRLKRKFP